MIRLKFKLKTALSIGGFTSSLFFDKTTARDGEGIPIIPATAIKGALRMEFKRIFQDGSATDSIFGNPTKESILRFENGYPAGDAVSYFRESQLIRPLGYQSRKGVAISRKLRTAKEEHLFDFETTAPFLEGLEFIAQLKSEEFLNTSLKEMFLKYLKILKKTGIFIGGDKSRGCGYFEFDFEQIETSSQNRQTQLQKSDTYIIRLIPEEEFRVSFLKPREFFYESVNHIPGSTVRGALAKKWIENYGKNQEFYNTFLKSPISFTHLYPSIGFAISKPIPFSARTCKAYPGMRICSSSASWQTETTHGVKDILVESFILKKLKEGGVDVFISDFEKCFCGNSLDTIEGFYIWIDKLPQKIPLQSHFETKLKLDPKVMTAEEGNLYSYEVWDKKIKHQREYDEYSFVGFMASKDFDTIKKIFNIGETLIGGGRRRGFGKMKIEMKPYQDECVEKRLKLFNEKLIERVKEIKEKLKIQNKPPPEFEKRVYFSLTQFTDIILPFNKNLYELLREKIDKNLLIEAGFLRDGLAGGYNSALNIRKDLRATISKGSVLLLSTEMKNDDLITKLKAIEEEGLGLRTYEGFGKVFFCDKFHYLLFEQT